MRTKLCLAVATAVMVGLLVSDWPKSFASDGQPTPLSSTHAGRCFCLKPSSTEDLALALKHLEWRDRFHDSDPEPLKKQVDILEETQQRWQGRDSEKMRQLVGERAMASMVIATMFAITTHDLLSSISKSLEEPPGFIALDDFRDPLCQCEESVGAAAPLIPDPAPDLFPIGKSLLKSWHRHPVLTNHPPFP
jgi:hypothetical protein